MREVFWILLAINYLLAIGTIIVILLRPREPRAMVAWIFAVLLLPFVGVFFFVAIGTPRLERTKRRRRRRRQTLAILLSKRAPIDELHAVKRLGKLDPATGHLMKLATRVTSYPPTHSNHVVVYPQSDASVTAVRDLIVSAQHHVHLEYYIFRPDETGTMIRDAIIAKAREGVQCRVLIDYLGSWSTGTKFIKPMIDAGVEFAYFLPVAPWQGPWRFNLRNHRKLVVVDGRYGFTGSHNIGNEYRGRHPTLGSWNDTNMSIEGPAVQQLQEIFVEDWFYSSGRELVSDDYFPMPKPVGQHVVQVIPSGPDVETNAILDVVFSAITSAQKSVCIMTPYFVPEVSLLQALESAAYGGVKVQVIIPSGTDNALALWAGRSFYPELIRAGVEIHEFDHGMLHNKVLVVDDYWSMIGSANMDHRSFRLNFEMAIVLYDPGLASGLLKNFRGFLGQSRRIGPDWMTHWHFHQRLALGAARLISPLL